MLNLVEKWSHGNSNDNKNTAWVIKHASRGLIKSGNRRALSLFGVNSHVKIEFRRYKLSATSISLGEYLTFSFVLKSTAQRTQKLIIDYRVYFIKNNGNLKPKVFKIKEMNIEGGELVEINKKHLFKNFTTRKHYAGKHALEIVINGNAVAKKQFALII